MSKFLDFSDNLFSAGNRVLTGVNNLSSTIGGLSQSFKGFNDSSRGFVNNWNDLKPLELQTNNTVKLDENQADSMKKYGLIGAAALVGLIVLKKMKIL
ncbi:MAG TPA: hypothetical protein DCG75_03595 [Bacteroidales bacterium]|nr:hypothetical protein [Bacteroidales bacterium]